jgi:hypothetical protein
VLALWVHTLLILVVLVGIAWRRRSRATLAFPLYLAFSVACCALQLAAAIDSEDWLPWLLLDLAQRILALCVAVEIAARIFHRDIPGGRTYTGRVFVVVLGLGLVAALLWGRALLGSVSDRELYFALVEGGRRVALTSATAFALLGLAVVTVFDWHLDPYHRDVGTGFFVYQWVYMLAAPRPRGFVVVSPEIWPVWLYGAVLLLWAWAAWRPVDRLGLKPKEWALVLPWQKV